MNRFKTQLLALATLFFPFTASAQYTIYPIPHTQTAGKGSKVAFTKNVNIVCDDAIDTYTRQRAQTILAEHGFTATISTTESNTLSNIYLGVASGNGLTKVAATKL
jgi:hyaluronoglucosaminidase